jgi:hypothetical protein
MLMRWHRPPARPARSVLADARPRHFYTSNNSLAPLAAPPRRLRYCRAAATDNSGGDNDGADAIATAAAADAAAEALRRTTEQYGLEAGLLQVATAKAPDGAAPGTPTRAQQAKQLLAQYGGAYLLTSISFAAVSFALCYAAVSAGLDVRSLLARLGLQASDASEKVGTFAIAYAAHKALSPVRFPPTVALTPVVAKWIGKQRGGEEKDKGGGGK